MAANFLTTIGRLRWIQRWSLLRNTLSENVMEHSWETAVIAHMLGCINNSVFGGGLCPERLSTLALYHDAAESVHGDLPTPVKYYSPEIQKAYQVIERDAENSLVAMLPEALQKQMQQYISHASASFEERKFIKAADCLSAYMKARAELANGNRDYQGAHELLKSRLEGLALREIDYFVNRFVEGAQEYGDVSQLKDSAQSLALGGLNSL